MRFDAVKFVNHADDHPEDPVLRVRPVHAQRLAEFYKELSTALSLAATDKPKVVLRHLHEQLTSVEGLDAQVEEFNPLVVLPPQLVQSDKAVFFTLGDPEDVWQVSTTDLTRYFDSMWYPGPDDLTIIDPRAQWAIGVSHHGAVSVWLPDKVDAVARA